MYSTADIASFLGTDRPNVNYYIRQGHLKATMVDGNYEVSAQDYHSFRDEYYDSNLRHSRRGTNKKLTDTQVKLLAFIVADLQNNQISLKEFQDKYKQELHDIPQFKDYVIYKRDVSIRYDNKHKGYRYQKLADDYGLSVRSIQEIINTKESL